MGDRLYSNKASDRAKDILIHYMELLFEKTGIYLGADNKRELEQLIDEIILASKED